MPRTLGYTQRVHIDAPIDEVWSLLADPRRHVELHPLIHELIILDEGDGPEPGERYVDFEVLDGVKLLGVEFPVKYQSHMIQRPSTRSLSLRAMVPPRLVTTVEWSLSTVDGGTQIDEQVELTAPWSVAGFSTRQSRRAHIEMFAALKRVCGSR